MINYMDLMASKPRLYARTRMKKLDSTLVSSFKPDVLVLLGNKDHSTIITNLLKKKPILCQVIELSSIDSLDRYYKSHNDNDQIVYLIISVSFARQVNKLAKKRENFYTVPTTSYTLYPFDNYRHCTEDFHQFNDAEQLGKSLRDYLNSLLTLDHVELSSQSVSIQTPRFAWFQFMFTLLSDLERSDIHTKEIIDKLHSYNYICESKEFQEFVKTYTADQAIDWCMKNSFYFPHINRIIRSKDLNNIFAHRAIIHDIEQNLISLHHDQQLIWDNFLPMNVYRGQKTSKQELQSWKSNIGSIITMNSFLSTSMDEKIANVFTETFRNDDNDDEATLLTIRLDKNTAPKAMYVYLYHEDYDIDDCEILFSLRTLFRIDQVKYSKFKETWLVHMTVIDEDNEDVQRMINPWKTSILSNKKTMGQKNEQLIYVRDLSADNGAFLAFQLSLDIVLRLDRNDFARQEMLSMCRTKFHNDQLILSAINQFERTYRSEQDAVRWYTENSFLYRILNEVLRSETIDSIFKFRYYIQDLHNHLALMQIDYLKILQQSHCSILRLYRGQIMTWHDLETKFRVNKGNLVSMNSFLSTTTDRCVARLFSGDGMTEDPRIYVSVLYEITVDTRLSHSVPFAELVGQTNFVDEEEVLFSMGAVFRIEDTYEENRYLWTVKLTLTTEEDEQWNILTEHLQQEEEEAISIVDEDRNISMMLNPIPRRRSRSFDDYRFSKRDLRRLHWSNSFRRKIIQRFEHQPAFQTAYKEI